MGGSDKTSGGVAINGGNYEGGEGGIDKSDTNFSDTDIYWDCVGYNTDKVDLPYSY